VLRAVGANECIGETTMVNGLVAVTNATDDKNNPDATT
jgi:hypothetical protein